MFTEVREQTFIANGLYGVLGFILALGLHELIHRLMFYIFSHGEHPRVKSQKGVLGFILALGLHELIHRLMFYIFSHGEHPRVKSQKGILLVHSSNKYFNKWQYCTIMLAPMILITASLMVVFSYYSYSSILFILSIHIGYCLIDVYLVGVTLINKFKYIHPSEEGLYMYYHKPLQTHNYYE
ncbi:DUF3267 domain-containing protein [Staphylococcus sp. H8/1]|nr:DUF3267 domain-containing protein [Staphylococcus caledonicus]MBI5973740.1 DUF3267 domain-containing protein [Staphylococcus caledonicus]